MAYGVCPSCRVSWTAPNLGDLVLGKRVCWHCATITELEEPERREQLEELEQQIALAYRHAS